MTDVLPFIQDQTYEGILAHFTQTDGSDLDISAATELEMDVFKSDYSALLFSGSKTGGECQFLTDGTDGKFVYNTQSGDMDEFGNYRGEARVTLGGKVLKKQRCIVKIERKAPST